MEDYVSNFLYTLQKNPHHVLSKDSQRLVFLRGVNDNCLEALDLMAGSDVYQASWDDLKKIYQNYSRSTMKKGRGSRSIATKGISQGITKLEISNLLSDFKQDIMNDVSTHLDTMNTKKKHAEAELQLAEYCPHCRKQKKDCQCKLVASMENQHLPTEYLMIDGDDEQVFFVSQCRPWAQHQGMLQDPLQNSNSYDNQWQNHNSQGPPQYQPNWNNVGQDNPQLSQWSQNNQW